MVNEALALETVEDFFNWERTMVAFEQSHEIVLTEFRWELLKDELNGSCILTHRGTD